MEIRISCDMRKSIEILAKCGLGIDRLLDIKTKVLKRAKVKGISIGKIYYNNKVLRIPIQELTPSLLADDALRSITAGKIETTDQVLQIISAVLSGLEFKDISEMINYIIHWVHRTDIINKLLPVFSDKFDNKISAAIDFVMNKLSFEERTQLYNVFMGWIDEISIYKVAEEYVSKDGLTYSSDQVKEVLDRCITKETVGLLLSQICAWLNRVDRYPEIIELACVFAPKAKGIIEKLKFQLYSVEVSL